jgi:hypothetical protein
VSPKLSKLENKRKTVYLDLKPMQFGTIDINITLDITKGVIGYGTMKSGTTMIK